MDKTGGLCQDDTGNKSCLIYGSNISIIVSVIGSYRTANPGDIVRIPVALH